MAKVKNLWRDWIAPGIVIVITLAIVASLVLALVRTGTRFNRAVDYCYGLGLPTAEQVKNVYYCIGVKDGNSVIVPIPDAILENRKE